MSTLEFFLTLGGSAAFMLVVIALSAWNRS